VGVILKAAAKRRRPLGLGIPGEALMFVHDRAAGESETEALEPEVPP